MLCADIFRASRSSRPWDMEIVDSPFVLDRMRGESSEALMHMDLITNSEIEMTLRGLQSAILNRVFWSSYYVFEGRVILSYLEGASHGPGWDLTGCRYFMMSLTKILLINRFYLFGRYVFMEVARMLAYYNGK